MTFSIVAKDPATGTVGIAVASRFFACGAIVPYVSHLSAVASQAFINPLWGIEGLQKIDAGDPAQTVLDALIARDEGQASRQAHLIDRDGQIAQHTGADCVPWAGHLSGKNVSVAGNMLVGPAVLDDMLTAWHATKDISFPERLLVAMEAGEQAGGDRRGRQAAGLIVHEGQPYPALDLRVDDHADPLSELRRLMAVSQERFAIFKTAMPTRENFSGMLDRTPLDAAIADKERQMTQDGIASRSYATPST